MDITSVSKEQLSLNRPNATAPGNETVSYENQDCKMSIYPVLVTEKLPEPGNDIVLEIWQECQNPWMKDLPYTSIDQRDQALDISRQASRAHLHPNQSQQLSFWTDGATTGPGGIKRVDCGGIGIAHRPLCPGKAQPESDWWHCSYVARSVRHPHDIEVLAIVEAIKLAHKECQQLQEETPDRMPTMANIFSDSQGAIAVFRQLRLDGLTAKQRRIKQKRGRQGRLFALRAVRFIDSLRFMNVRVHLRWVPGHSPDRGNHWADRAAKLALSPYFARHVDCGVSTSTTLVFRHLHTDMVEFRKAQRSAETGILEEVGPSHADDWLNFGL